MSRSETLDRWKPAVINAGSALAVGVLGWLIEGRLTPFVALAAAIALGWGWWVSPLRRAQPHVAHRDALRRASRRDVIVYWRPGCSWCLRLWRALEADVRDRVIWVNVMADPEGSRYIRQFHEGDMVTPTAITGNGRQVAATAESITSRVAQRSQG